MNQLLTSAGLTFTLGLGIFLYSPNDTLIVLSAPSVNVAYYAEFFDDIIDFQVGYAEKIMAHDDVVVLADKATLPYLEGRLPEALILEAEVADIWMRDFTSIDPKNPVQLSYEPSYLDGEDDGFFIQNSFNSFLANHGESLASSSLILDGGNYVDNYAGKAIVSERFLEDNNLSYEAGHQALSELMNLDSLAIIPYDDEVMGHADGMLMWIEEDIIGVNKYDEPFRSSVIDELEFNFPGVEIVEFEADFELVEWKNFSSACGVNLNSLMTDKHIYVPTFDSEADQVFIDELSLHTSKKIIPVPASKVCIMGGSVRCLSWQVQGNLAGKLIRAARNN